MTCNIICNQARKCIRPTVKFRGRIHHFWSFTVKTFIRSFIHSSANHLTMRVNDNWQPFPCAASLPHIYSLLSSLAVRNSPNLLLDKPTNSINNNNQHISWLTSDQMYDACLQRLVRSKQKHPVQPGGSSPSSEPNASLAHRSHWRPTTLACKHIITMMQLLQNTRKWE